ncbi:MAG TPA: DUF126 domain-containing protein [Spirochaetales bacterium]|nr:DUF126 domain-containing protein [Spirochaetales bacterium]HPG86322.1 DUF126 domain-containing protein [Spirochaetales bacterium]HPM73619.1 DUF126 domain-containing protein [Spirochaetales bacterium]HQO65881.1 DUF126 domain-containing protein [Spirochaetales bacterium]
MKKSFKGRAVVPGTASGEAVVSRRGFNILASMQRDLMGKKAEVRCSDQNNPDAFGRALSGRILCLPRTIGSTTGGMVLQAAAALGKAPAALLFSEPIDSLAAGGVILAKVWNGRDIVTVDGLGDEFLAAVENGAAISVEADGIVTIETA